MDSEKRDTVVQTMVSVLKARSPYDPAIQRIMIDHCRTGNTDLMEQALAEYLIADGLVRSIIPVPTHPIDIRLAERAIAACVEILAEYLKKGGVLLARRFSTAQSMHDRMLHVWKHLKLPQIENTEDLPAFDKEHERIARAACAAQALKMILDQKHYTQNGFQIEHKDVEDFCMTAVKAMERAYRAPDAWIAEKLGNAS